MPKTLEGKGKGKGAKVTKVVTKALTTGAIVPGTIKVVVQKIPRFGAILVYFHPVITGWINIEILPEICLSRIKPGKCNFRLDRLDMHDHHTPPFDDEEACDVYITRVLTDIIQADCGGVKIEVDIQLVEQPIEAEFSVEEK